MKPFQGMNANNTALLIIDVMNSCAAEKCEIPEWDIHFTKIRAMVPKLATFVEQFRTTIKGPVVFGRTLPWQKEYLRHNVNELYEQEEYAYYTRDRSGFAEEFYAIQPQAGDIVSEKDTNDALADEALLADLRKRGIKYVVVTGIFTDGCVLATVLGGFSRGFSMVVLSDLVETTDSVTRQRIQKDLLEYTFPYMFARVVSSAALLESWPRA